TGRSAGRGRRGSTCRSRSAGRRPVGRAGSKAPPTGAGAGRSRPPPSLRIPPSSTLRGRPSDYRPEQNRETDCLRRRPQHLVAVALPKPTYGAQMANQPSTGLTITFWANRAEGGG